MFRSPEKFQYVIGGNFTVKLGQAVKNRFQSDTIVVHLTFQYHFLLPLTLEEKLRMATFVLCYIELYAFVSLFALF